MIMSIFDYWTNFLVEVKKYSAIIILRKIYTFLKIIVIFLFGGFVALLCYALIPFVKIRFGHLYTSRIGHLCYNMDNYISDRKRRNSSEIGVFVTDKRIANNAVFLLWQEQKNIYFTKYAQFPLSFLKKYIPDSTLLISWTKEMHPGVSTVSASPMNIFCDKLQKSHEDIEGFKSDRTFICMHNRDSGYLGHYGGDGNNHDFRDFDFDDFAIAIDKVGRQNIYSVRLGEIIEKISEVTNSFFIEMTGNKRSDYIDVLLIYKCLFFVGCNTGFSVISRVFRKPELLINYIPFKISELSAWAANSLVIPKKLYNLKEKKYLTFSEMNALKYDIHYKGDFFSDNGIRVDNNSPEEIADAVLEMKSRVEGTWVDSGNQQKLQFEFWNSLTDSFEENIIRHDLHIVISSTFLERNPHLI